MVSVTGSRCWPVSVRLDKAPRFLTRKKKHLNVLKIKYVMYGHICQYAVHSTPALVIKTFKIMLKYL